MNGVTGVSRTADIAAMLEKQDRRGFIYRLLAWSVFIMILDGFSMAILALAAPYIMKEWGLGAGAFGIVFGLAQVGILAGAAVLGFHRGCFRQASGGDRRSAPVRRGVSGRAVHP